MSIKQTKAFAKDLERLINKHSMENGSDTPDWILAEYLMLCLKAFNRTSKLRARWFIRDTRR